MNGANLEKNISPLSWKHTTRIRFVERMPGLTPEVTIGPIPEN